VARIVSALKSNDDIRFAGKKVDDLAFTFIAPLGANDRNVGHGSGNQ
jgi:hypothetical protein